MNKIDKSDYQASEDGVSDASKLIAEKILELIRTNHLPDPIEIQDFDVEIYVNHDPLGRHPMAFVVDIQIKGISGEAG